MPFPSDTFEVMQSSMGKGAAVGAASAPFLGPMAFLPALGTAALDFGGSWVGS